MNQRQHCTQIKESIGDPMPCSKCGEGAAAVQALPVQVTNAGDCPCLCGFSEQVRKGCASVNVRPTS